jgi:hypothetical protein
MATLPPEAKQSTPPKVKKDWSKVTLSPDRPSDHFMIQFGSDTWLNKTDSIHTKGFSRHFNFYFMLDKPFKTNPRFSIAYGLGIGSSNIFFNDTYVDVRSNNAKLPFTDVSQANHFTKFKLTMIRLELPIELRFYADPENPKKSWKGAIGVKAGYLLNAYTKGKNLENSAGQSIYGSSYIEKESDTKFFSSARLAGTLRVGKGAFSLHADFDATPIIKSGFGPDVRTLSIGLTVSGL